MHLLHEHRLSRAIVISKSRNLIHLSHSNVDHGQLLIGNQIKYLNKSFSKYTVDGTTTHKSIRHPTSWSIPFDRGNFVVQTIRYCRIIFSIKFVIKRKMMQRTLLRAAIAIIIIFQQTGESMRAREKLRERNGGVRAGSHAVDFDCENLRRENCSHV